MELEEELQKIYNSEINIEISWLWDGGIDLRLPHGFENELTFEECRVDSIDEVLSALIKMIKIAYPNSEYVKNLKDSLNLSDCCGAMITEGGRCSDCKDGV